LLFRILETVGQGRKRRFHLPAEPSRRRVLVALGYYDQHLHRGIARYARQAGWVLDTHMTHYGVLPPHWHGDGIIALLFPERTDLIAYVHRFPGPVVDLNHDVKLALPRVLLANEEIGRLGAAHLIERGFEHLAFLKVTDAADIREREPGFSKAVRTAGRTLHPLDCHRPGCTTGADWFDRLVRSLRALPKPLGIMAQSDNKAIALLNACEAAGLFVPEQVAVLGVDNDELACEFAPVHLSSVDSNREELAYRGAALLDRLMSGGAAPPQPLRIQPKGVVVRASSDILALRHVDVASALRFIWRHFRGPIMVEHVLESGSMSRCGLYRAFERHVGRNIAEEIARKRIELAQDLLAGTKE